MYEAEIAGSTVQAGDNLIIPHIVSDIELKILEIFSDSFSVKWLNGKHKGKTDTLHFDLFGDGSVKSYKVSTKPDDPNTAFRRKKREVY